MLQASLSITRRAAPSWFETAGALVILAAGLFAAATPVLAQTRAAAVGLHRAVSTQFLVDGDFDAVSDLTVTFGASTEIGLLADLTGAGMRSPATFNPSTGAWRFDVNRDGAADLTVYFGGVGDKPLVADFDGDGKDDLIVYRGGIWLISTTGDGRVTAAYEYGGGQPQDIPLMGDMNGDGLADLIIYRNGTWLISTRRDGVADIVVKFGGASDGRDVPVVLDYDGDGVEDLGIFRNGQWYVSTRRDGVANVQFSFGSGGDRPLYFGRGATETPQVQAARLLQQATFGPTQAEISRVLAMGTTAWVDDQLSKPMTPLPALPWFPASRPANTALPFCQYAAYTTTPYNSATPCNCSNQAGTTNQCDRDTYSVFQLQRAFFRNALTAPDQLRQRVAWALSQIVVTSAAQDPIAYGNRDYQQLIMNYAFGNYYDLINNVTVSPFMGNYLDMVNNRKAAGTRQPNENYAREILQLFTIGLWELKDDGTLLLDAFGNPVPTYDQADITELARVYTGWVYPPVGAANPAFNSTVNYAGTMRTIETEHDTGSKRILDLGTIGAGLTASWDASTANFWIFQHVNVGPFIAKQLIQQLVTSNPSPDYVRRITAMFNNNGSGVRGDLRAVVRAILLDPEARAPRNPVVSTFGKLKEPVLFVTGLYRALGVNSDGVDPRIRTTAMQQNVYTSPTVFNYYPADYVVPGTELVGPPFGIFDATTYFARTNWVYNQVTLGAACTGMLCGPGPDATVVGSVGSRVDYAALQALAADPATLVDQVNTMLLQGTMPRYVRQQIVNAVAAVPSATATDLLNRARTAVYLAASSPRYQTEF